MRDEGDRRFYTSADVDHRRVREIMRDAGNRERPYPLAWLGVSGWKFLITAAQAPKTAQHFEHLEPAGHDYGPHRDEDAPELGTVAVLVRGQWTHPQLDDVMLRQRRQINQLAHEKRRR